MTDRSPTATRAAAPVAADGLDDAWLTALEPLLRTASGEVSLGRGWDLERERGHWLRAAGGRTEHLSVRVHDDEVLVGPRWVPGTDAGCAGCAEVRARVAVTHPLVADLSEPCSRPAPRRPALLPMLAAASEHLAERPLRPGELYAVGRGSVRRHRVVRAFDCPLCAPAPAARGAAGPAPAPVPPPPPEPLVLHSRPVSPRDPTRGTGGSRLLRPGVLREKLADPRFGPVLEVIRESRAPFAMSMAAAPESIAMGYGRAFTFAEAEPVAVLEAYERMAGFPHAAPVFSGLAHRDVPDIALDPRTLGRYTPEQLARPSCRVTPSDTGTPMDWVWGHDLDTGRPLLVPADIGFYQYDYRYRTDRWAARAEGAAPRRHFFHESSSGCALGSSLEEAALHSLLELAERDAFLISWHRAAPLPSIDPATVTDPASRRLMALVESRGFDIHLLVATQDIGVPVVWAMALNRAGDFPATFSAAGSGIRPESVVRAALWELGQIVTDPVEWDRAQAEAMLEDPWRIEVLDDHLRLHALPEKRDRVTTVLGGPRVALEDAFPGWPQKLERAAAGDVRGALEYVRGLYSAAGLDRIVLVDQTTRDHADLGTAVAKAVVPGIVPMCFGHAHQRLAGLPRLAAALAGTPSEHASVPYDPHPFP
ncbi:TOMM precursor leader peptide-binding protein [Streptomyces fenghuangensis]